MGPVMIRMAYMPLYIEKNWDVPPVHGRTDQKWKEVQYSALAESKIFKQTVAHFREGGGQLVTSVVLERNGLPVMPTNRVIPVIQVTKLRCKIMAEVSTRRSIHPLSQHLRSCRSPPPPLDSLWLSSSLSFHASHVRWLRFKQHLSHHTD